MPMLKEKPLLKTEMAAGFLRGHPKLVIER